MPLVSLVRRTITAAVLGGLFTLVARADYTGPVPLPTDSFGGPGRYAVATETVPSPDWSGQVVTVFHPVGVDGACPTWFFAHGFAGTDPAYYREFLTHLASHGFAVVFSPYPADLLKVADNYATVFDGFAAAAQTFPTIIDTTRVGFAGHSYGGGAVPALALRALREKHWGASGVALLLLAPWYAYGVSDADLTSFPSGTQAVVQIYEDDTTNDHRMAIDLFAHLGLAAADKEFLLVHSDRIDGYNYAANHLVPTGASAPRPGAAFNALDVWGMARVATALGGSVWQHDPAARAIALGHGAPAQTQMGVAPSGRALRPMTSLAQPVPLFPSSRYVQRWDSALNPRRTESLPAPVQAAHLTNLSVRAVPTDAATPLIVGATVAGERPKSLLLRAVGPGLTAFGISGAAADPSLRTFVNGAVDMDIDDWRQSPDADAFAAATAETGAFPLAAGSKDAAILATFAPGAVTLHAAPGPSAGVTLVEAYEADDDAGTTLVNLSARAPVASGDGTLIAGFIVSGPGSLRLLVRAVGPGLRAFGVSGTVADPQLEIDRGPTNLAANDDWSSDAVNRAVVTDASAKVGAFPLAAGSADAATVINATPGVYSVVVRSRDTAPGNALVEVYVVP